MSTKINGLRLVVTKTSPTPDGTPRYMIGGVIIGDIGIPDDELDSVEIWGLEIPGEAFTPKLRWRGKEGEARHLNGTICQIMTGAMSDPDGYSDLYREDLPQSEWITDQKWRAVLDGQ